MDRVQVTISPDEVFLRYPDLRSRGIGYSRQHLTVLEDAGRFPRRVHLSDRVVAWRLSEILEWMAERTGQR